MRLRVLLAALLFGVPVHAFTVTRIADVRSLGDVAISGSNVVWSDRGGSDGDIYFWDGSTITQITENIASDKSPAISGSSVVWSGCDGGAVGSCDGGDWEIYLWDGSFPVQIEQITNNGTDDVDPDISGSTVVWACHDGSDDEICFWDGSFPIQIQRITDDDTYDQLPAISGSNVVWRRWDLNDWEICFWDGSFPIQIEQITNNYVHDFRPAISGSTVVWPAQPWDYPWSDYEIYLWDGSTITQITDSSFHERNPAISGSNVVWEGCDDGSPPLCNGRDQEIQLWDGSAITQITDNRVEDRAPAISGANIVWRDSDAIYMTSIQALPTPTASPTPTALPTPTPLTKRQQACVNEINKNGEKVNQAQLRENERCLKDHQKRKLATTFEVCTTADRKGRVQRAMEETVMGEEKKCDPLAVRPPLAVTDSSTVNAAAAYGARELTYAIFGGPPVDEFDLATRVDAKAAAKCQLEMLKQAGRLESAVLGEINKAVKQALKDAGADRASKLEAVLMAVLTWNDRIAEVEGRLMKKVDRQCAALQATPDQVFPGACVDVSLREIENCVIAAARCQACLKINAFADLHLDCDQADDGGVNGSCP